MLCKACVWMGINSSLTRSLNNLMKHKNIIYKGIFPPRACGGGFQELGLNNVQFKIGN